jgi:hypothetical protein
MLVDLPYLIKNAIFERKRAKWRDRSGKLMYEINVADTLQLFLPIFPDSVVRAKAVSWLEQENSDQVSFSFRHIK